MNFNVPQPSYYGVGMEEFYLSRAINARNTPYEQLVSELNLIIDNYIQHLRENYPFLEFTKALPPFKKDSKSFFLEGDTIWYWFYNEKYLMATTLVKVTKQ